jgi:hypothetical protein
MTSSGIEPATFQPAAWCLNQLRYGMPYTENISFSHKRETEHSSTRVMSCLDPHQSSTSKWNIDFGKKITLMKEDKWSFCQNTMTWIHIQDEVKVHAFKILATDEDTQSA